MKWTDNGYQLIPNTRTLKYMISFFAAFTLSACISTAEFTAANDINLMDNNLTSLLMESSSKNYTGEKKQIAYLAALAHESGDAMAMAGSPKLALAYYRIAAVGYWRDDVDTNDNQLFDVIDSAKLLCDKLQSVGKAPDRDCFIIQITLSLEVLEGKYAEIAEFKQQDFTPNNIADVRRRLDELGYQADNDTAKSTGFLVKFISTANNNTAFLNKHPTMKAYMVETISKATDYYTKSMNEVANYYRNHDDTVEEAKMIEMHPIYKAFLSRGETIKSERIKAMIDEWLGSD